MLLLGIYLHHEGISFVIPSVANVYIMPPSAGIRQALLICINSLQPLEVSGGVTAHFTGSQEGGEVSHQRSRVSFHRSHPTQAPSILPQQPPPAVASAATETRTNTDTREPIRIIKCKSKVKFKL